MLLIRPATVDEVALLRIIVRDASRRLTEKAR
jgi:hypothetical protein